MGGPIRHRNPRCRWEDWRRQRHRRRTRHLRLHRSETGPDRRAAPTDPPSDRLQCSRILPVSSAWGRGRRSGPRETWSTSCGRPWASTACSPFFPRNRRPGARRCPAGAAGPGRIYFFMRLTSMVRRIQGRALTQNPDSLHSESGDSGMPPAIAQIRTGSFPGAILAHPSGILQSYLPAGAVLPWNRESASDRLFQRTVPRPLGWPKGCSNRCGTRGSHRRRGEPPPLESH